MIEFLATICFLAVAGYCLVVLWPHLRWTALTSRTSGGVRRQYSATETNRGIRTTTPSSRTRSFRETSATAGLYSHRSEEFVRRGAAARNAMNREPGV
jgi:hypothetical protein